MSEKFEPCTLEEATHIEIGGNLYEFGTKACTKEYVFQVLGIKTFKEVKREPRECMALTVIAQRNGKDVIALLPSDDFELGMTVRCVEILEDEK